jgi:hypothetical protein
LTADRVVTLDEMDRGVAGETSALVILDRATKWLECYPIADKSSDEVVRALKDCVGPAGHVGLFYTDCSPELDKARKEMKWLHRTSTPGRPQSNGVAERAVRKVLEGSRTLCEHAGLDAVWWPKAARHYCLSNNTEIREGGSPWSRRILRLEGSLRCPS